MARKEVGFWTGRVLGTDDVSGGHCSVSLICRKDSASLTLNRSCRTREFVKLCNLGRSTQALKKNLEILAEGEKQSRA